MTRMIEIDEHGTLTIPKDMLSQATPHSRYLVERSGNNLNVTPANDRNSKSVGHKERMRQWKCHAEQVAMASPNTKSVVELVSEMRR